MGSSSSKKKPQEPNPAAQRVTSSQSNRPPSSGGGIGPTGQAFRATENATPAVRSSTPMSEASKKSSAVHPDEKPDDAVSIGSGSVASNDIDSGLDDGQAHMVVSDGAHKSASRSRSIAPSSGKASSVESDPHDHCSHCPHCQRLSAEKKKPKVHYTWVTDNPGLKKSDINMDKYDVDATNERIISEHGHLLGSYDYRPYLTIEKAPDENERCAELDYKETFIVRKKKPPTPMHTPYPGFNVIQRREQRLNKPYTQDLYAD